MTAGSERASGTGETRLAHRAYAFLLRPEASVIVVSVALVLSTDNGGTRFGFFLPDVQVARGQTAPVTTIGVFETFSGPDSVPHRATTWQCVHLHGTAQEVIVPL